MYERPEREQRMYQVIAQKEVDLLELYLRDNGDPPLLSEVEERGFAQKLRAGGEDAQDALRELTSRNLRLVLNIARRYQNCGVPLPDLVQEGNFGLLKALQKFDPDKGFRLSTYATWWIRQAITRAIADTGRAIRIPVHRHDELFRFHRSVSVLAQHLGHTPSDAEIVEFLEVEHLYVREMQEISQRPLSLERPNDPEDSASDTLADVIEDTAPDPSEILDTTLRKEWLGQVLEALDERSRQILTFRFGLHDGRPYTLDEVGQIIGLTRERVRQIEASALTQLRVTIRRYKGMDDI